MIVRHLELKVFFKLYYADKIKWQTLPSSVLKWIYTTAQTSISFCMHLAACPRSYLSRLNSGLIVSPAWSCWWQQRAVWLSAAQFPCRTLGSHWGRPAYAYAPDLESPCLLSTEETLLHCNGNNGSLFIQSESLFIIIHSKRTVNIIGRNLSTHQVTSGNRPLRVILRHFNIGLFSYRRWIGENYNKVCQSVLQ